MHLKVFTILKFKTSTQYEWKDKKLYVIWYHDKVEHRSKTMIKQPATCAASETPKKVLKCEYVGLGLNIWV